MWVGQTVKIIVDGGPIIRAVEKRSMAFSFNVAGRRCRVARSSHSFNNLAAHTSVLPVYQTSGFRLTYKSVSRLVAAIVTLNLGLFDHTGDKNIINDTCRGPGTCLQIFLKHILKALKLDKGSSTQ